MDLLRDRPSTRADLGRGEAPLRTTISILIFGLLPLLLLAGFTIGAASHRFSFDFHTFWEAARAVARGDSPYPAPSTIANSHPSAGDYEYFVYPPPVLLGVLPFAALPFALASGLWTAVLVACVAVTLYVLDVRDWRCYGLTFATAPVLSSFRLGAVTPILMLLIALAWRHRGSRWKVGAAVGCAIVIKLFLWPLALWLLVTRRWRAALVAVGGACAVTAVMWAALGLDGLADYPALLRNLSRIEGRESYSLIALAERMHLADPSTTWVLVAIPPALALIVGCLLLGRGDLDRSSYTAAIGVVLLLTPIAWLNYFALLVVPVALRRKTLGLEWAVLALFWLTPSPEPRAHPLWQLTLVLVLVLVASRPSGRQAALSRPARAAAPAPATGDR